MYIEVVARKRKTNPYAWKSCVNKGVSWKAHEENHISRTIVLVTKQWQTKRCYGDYDNKSVTKTIMTTKALPGRL